MAASTGRCVEKQIENVYITFSTLQDFESEPRAESLGNPGNCIWEFGFPPEIYQEGSSYFLILRHPTSSTFNFHPSHHRDTIQPA